MNTGLKRLAALAALATGACLAAGDVLAEGTPAGTVIENTATVSFELDGTPTTLSSNTASVTVVERLDVSVSLQTAQRLVSAGGTNEALLYTVVNTGNGSETFTLAVNSVVAGDDFDPVPSAIAIYFDTDGSGDLTAGDIAYAPGSNDPVLAADESIAVLVVNDIPATVSNGQRGLSELIVNAVTAAGGTPGSSYPGQGDGGVDAVLGTSRATATVAGEYLVSDVQVSIVKTQQVTDPFGGSAAVPGATVTYSIVVEVSGSGSAPNSVVRDAIPQYTSYVSGSLTLNTTSLSDAADTDAGELQATPNPEIVVRLGDLQATDGPQAITFQVLID